MKDEDSSDLQAYLQERYDRISPFTRRLFNLGSDPLAKVFVETIWTRQYYEDRFGYLVEIGRECVERHTVHIDRIISALPKTLTYENALDAAATILENLRPKQIEEALGGKNSPH